MEDQQIGLTVSAFVCAADEPVGAGHDIVAQLVDRMIGTGETPGPGR